MDDLMQLEGSNEEVGRRLELVSAEAEELLAEIGAAIREIATRYGLTNPLSLSMGFWVQIF